MKRFLSLAIVLALAGFVVYRMGLRFVSDETKIRWRLETMATGFNETDRSDCLGAFADDFVHKSPAFDRERLGAFLVHVFLTGKHPKTKQFRYRVELPEEKTEIVVDSQSSETATVECEAVFFERSSQEWRQAWNVAVTAALEKRDGRWYLVRSEHKTVSGRRPFR